MPNVSAPDVQKSGVALHMFYEDGRYRKTAGQRHAIDGHENFPPRLKDDAYYRNLDWWTSLNGEEDIANIQ
jgi:hypothetical protein